MKYLVAGLAVTLAFVVCVGAPKAADDKDAKYTIKEVMKKAHKDGLLKKVASGKADEDERKELVVLYVALSQNKPPKGDADDWKEKTGAMVKAAKAAAADAKAGKEDRQLRRLP